MSSFTKKKIDVIMQLSGNRTFNDMGDNTITLKGLRVEANITQIGQVTGGSKANIKIYGMTQDDMNKLSVIGMGYQPIYVNQNRIQIFAGDEDNMTKVFEGNISQAWADYSSTPEVPMTIVGVPLLVENYTPAEANSWENEFDVGEALAMLAGKMGKGFLNVNVKQKHPKTTLKGTLPQQMKTLVDSAGIFSMEQFNLITIATKGTPLYKDIPVISPQTGMVGYPSFSPNGLSVTTLFNPEIKLASNVQIENSLELANGKWYLKTLNYALESEKQNGAWFCQLSLVPIGNYVKNAQANSPTQPHTDQNTQGTQQESNNDTTATAPQG